MEDGAARRRDMHPGVPTRRETAPWAGPRARSASRLRSLSAGVGREKERGTGSAV
jgi:hypothetical protein